MSYILDALNKSEKERARRRAPDLHALGDKATSSSMGTSQFIIVILVIVAINLAALWYFFGDQVGKAETTAPPALIDASVDESIDAAAPAADGSKALQPAKQVVATPRPLPEVDVTAHIYAEDQDLRMVKIDGISRKEGDVIQDGLTLLEITESGVILEYDNQQYVLNIVEDWQLY